MCYMFLFCISGYRVSKKVDFTIFSAEMMFWRIFEFAAIFLSDKNWISEETDETGRLLGSWVGRIFDFTNARQLGS
jgi:hypothetical protein